MNSAFDAHIHFNMQSDGVIDDLFRQIEINQLKGINLILNTKTEKAIFSDNKLRFFRLNIPIFISCGIDYKNPCDLNFYETLKKEGFRCCIKLHPRIHNITKKDFNNIKSAISSMEVDLIIVDAFLCGHNQENNIGIELALLLGSSFPNKKIVIAHSGGHKALECFLYAKNLYNIYFDTSFSINYFETTSIASDFLFLFRKFNKKIIFGSDYPDYTVTEALNCIERYFEKFDFTKEEISNILIGNAMKIYV